MRKLCLLFLLALAAAFPAWGNPPVYLDKVECTPDLTQTDSRARLPARGMAYCGPVAVSNSLEWLARNGYADLIPPMEPGGKPMTQSQLASLLAMEPYMNTSLKSGTGPAELVRGLAKFLKDRGYPEAKIVYRGWRKMPAGYSDGKKLPELAWIKESLLGDSAVWLNVGWYRHDREKDTYTREGGHWVTLVGYGENREGKPDPDVLLVHDSATRRKPKPGEDKPRPLNDFARLARISSGRLAGDASPLPVDAKGFYRIEGLTLRGEADTGVLDGVVALRLAPKKSP